MLLSRLVRLGFVSTSATRGAIARGTTVYCPFQRFSSGLPPFLFPTSLLFSHFQSMSSSTQQEKRAKTDSKQVKTIGTHSGTFQADEAMGVWMLRQLPEYKDSKLIRTRDNAVLDSSCDIVIDVGGIYDHSKLRYDHHQRGYDQRFDDGKDGKGRCTKLSACGLVYRHYGMDVIRSLYPNLFDSDDTTKQKEEREWVYTRLYNVLLEALDAIDTGVEMVPSDSDVRPLYSDCTGLSQRVSRLNPRWNEVGDQPTTSGAACLADERFEEACTLCGTDFTSVLTQIVESELPAREIVERALLARRTVDESGEILILRASENDDEDSGGGGVPWKNHLYDLEKKHGVDPLVKFVLYRDVGGNMWRVQAVTVEGKAFENRLSLPEKWRGLRDADLDAVSNIPNCRFVHAAGFIGGHSSLDGAKQMAQAALASR